VSVHFGRVGWLLADEAMDISTRGYIQRKRVEQTQQGDLSWLKPVVLDPPLPLMSAGEQVYLVLKAVTLRQASGLVTLGTSTRGSVMDSGKLYITDRSVHLLGQRRDWSHTLAEIDKVGYTENAWTIRLKMADEEYYGVYVADQLDPQLITMVVDELRLG
jgi:hypothetical protein